jgi:hypothetical protein
MKHAGIILTFLFCFSAFADDIVLPKFTVGGSVRMEDWMSLPLDTNSGAYGSLKTTAFNNIMFLNLSILQDPSQPSPWMGLAQVRLDAGTGSLRFSIDKAVIGWNGPDDKILGELFFRERVMNFNDPLRLLDGSEMIPQRFLQAERQITVQDAENTMEPYTDKWGREHFGMMSRVAVSGAFCQRNFLVSSLSDPGVSFMAGNRSELTFGPLQICLNAIFSKEDRSLPSVNNTGWAQVNGVWYGFITNSFYKPAGADYGLKATLELDGKLADIVMIRAEAGLDRQSGGMFSRAFQTTGASGNAPSNLELNFSPHDLLVAAVSGGIKTDLLEAWLDYSFKSGKAESFEYSSTANTPVISTNSPSIQNIRLSAVVRPDLGASFFGVSGSYSFTGSDTFREDFDPYNFGNLLAVDKLKTMFVVRSYNKIDLGIISITPLSVEYSSYNRDVAGSVLAWTTTELQAGISLPLPARLFLLASWRYKTYSLGVSRGDFHGYYGGLKWQAAPGSSIALTYGTDLTDDHDRMTGFDYVISTGIASGNADDQLQTILNAEKALASARAFSLIAELKF